MPKKTKTPYGFMTHKEIEDSIFEDMTLNFRNKWSDSQDIQEEQEFLDYGWRPRKDFHKRLRKHHASLVDEHGRFD